jgi:AraC-like DNA-binding protein
VEVGSTDAWELSALWHQDVAAGAGVDGPTGSLWLLVLHGAITLETASGVEALLPGDAVWVDGRTAYRLIARGDAEVAVADLHPMAPAPPLPSPMVVRGFAERHSGVTELVRRCPLGSECTPAVFAASYGGLVGASMVAAWREEHGGGDPESAALPDPAVAAVVAALANRPGDAWTVEQMARLVHLSRSALGERFRRALGMSPVRVLREIRMQQARALLAEGSRTVEQVGYAVGYGSSAAFSRAFSGHHRVAPQAWRETSVARNPQHGEDQSARDGARRPEQQRHLNVVRVDDGAAHHRSDRDRDLERGHLERQR